MQPLITSVTLMSLTSLSGLLNITFLLRSNFRLGHQPLQPSLLQPSQTQAQSLHSTVELGNSGFDLVFVLDFFFREIVWSSGVSPLLNFSCQTFLFFCNSGFICRNTVFSGQLAMFYIYLCSHVGKVMVVVMAVSLFFH